MKKKEKKSRPVHVFKQQGAAPPHRNLRRVCGLVRMYARAESSPSAAAAAARFKRAGQVEERKTAGEAARQEREETRGGRMSRRLNTDVDVGPTARR